MTSAWGGIKRRVEGQQPGKNTVRGGGGAMNLGKLFGRIKKLKGVGMRSGRGFLILCWQG